MTFSYRRFPTIPEDPVGFIKERLIEMGVLDPDLWLTERVDRLDFGMQFTTVEECRAAIARIDDFGIARVVASSLPLACKCASPVMPPHQLLELLLDHSKTYIGIRLIRWLPWIRQHIPEVTIEGVLNQLSHAPHADEPFLAQEIAQWSPYWAHDVTAFTRKRLITLCSGTYDDLPLFTHLSANDIPPLLRSKRQTNYLQEPYVLTGTQRRWVVPVQIQDVLTTACPIAHKEFYSITNFDDPSGFDTRRGVVIRIQGIATFLLKLTHNLPTMIGLKTLTTTDGRYPATVGGIFGPCRNTIDTCRRLLQETPDGPAIFDVDGLRAKPLNFFNAQDADVPTADFQRALNQLGTLSARYSVRSPNNVS